jgi:hypothetical protein
LDVRANLNFYPLPTRNGGHRLKWRMPKVLFLINRYALSPMLVYAITLSSILYFYFSQNPLSTPDRYLSVGKGFVDWLCGLSLTISLADFIFPDSQPVRSISLSVSRMFLFADTCLSGGSCTYALVLLCPRQCTKNQAII